MADPMRLGDKHSFGSKWAVKRLNGRCQGAATRVRLGICSWAE